MDDPRMDPPGNEEEGEDISDPESESDDGEEEGEEVDDEGFFHLIENLPPPQLQTAIAEFPGVLRVTDADGFFLLHRVVHKGLPAHVAFIVVHFSPESVRQRGRRGGELPIHLVNDQTDPTVVDFLTHLWPEAVHQTYGPGEERDGNFPLFCALRNGAPMEIVFTLFIARYQPDWQGGLPAAMAADHPAFQDGVRALQLALRANVSRPVLELISTGWPSSVEVRLGNGLTLLHLAVASGGERDVVEYLVRWRPAAVRDRDDEGNLPIHYAGWHPDEAWRANADAAQQLIEAWPESLLVPNHAGELAVHRAAKTNSLALVQLLAEQSPQLLRVRNAAGWTPLSVAVARPDSPPPDVVECLLNQWPGALQVRDHNGLLPLELAVAGGATLDVLFLCVLKWPECVPRGSRRA